jgi:transaldolase / glucose-6-phosphate isomerase
MPARDLSWSLPRDLDASVRDRIAQLGREDLIRRIWAGDSSVWSGADEDRWLGWLNLPTTERPSLDRLAAFADGLRRDGIVNVVLLGMGGSSLAPEVIRSILARSKHSSDLYVLDSTDPDQILSVERKIDLASSLFIVASKSGSTLEVNILKQYFFFRAVQQFGEAEAARRFVLTTDPGSKMQQIAEQENFREIFPGLPSVGGRYSALSNFGMVPAAAIGADVSTLLQRAEEMAHLCAAEAEENSAFRLGVLLGVAAAAGRDKPTLIAPAALASFGSWLEQLIAESTGKQGKGIIPIDGEQPGAPDVYGDDRVFVQLRSASAPDAGADAQADRLERAGHPVVRIVWADRYSLGGEFFRWEFATAVMGAVLGINPFDQPDVEESKVVTRRLAAEYERTGKLPEEEPLFQAQGLALFADARNRQWLGNHKTLGAYLQALLQQLRPRDYFALVAFIEMNEGHTRALQSIRGLIRDRTRAATTVGFGPRFLHSTGQAHKGGPNSGVFLQITADDPHDLLVPGQRYSFGTIKLAQARGDFEVLASRGRRAVRVHLNDVDRGLQILHAAIRDALRGVQ